MSSLQIYTLKSPAERVATKLAGTQTYRCDYRCGCSRSAKWQRWNCVEPDQRSLCPRCGAWREPNEVWEE